MAGEVNVSFLPLEAVGGNVANRGASGTSARMPALTGGGSVYQHSTAALTLPMLVVGTTFRTGDSFDVEARLPALTGQGGFGMGLRTALPMVALSATGTVTPIARAELDLPLLVVAGAGKTGSGFRVAAELPQLLVSMRSGGRAAAGLPLLQVAGSVWTMESGTSAGTLPLLRVLGTISVYSYPANGAVLLPALVSGPYGSARVSLPHLFAAGAFLLPETFEAWVMNVRNKGVTRWTNFPFVQFTSVGKSTYAVGNDGNLYLLGGDLDVAAPIAWEFETGLEDLGSPGLKHIPYLYLDGIIDGEIEIVVLDDRGREFAYEYDTKQRGAVHQPHRRKLGNGIRTRNVAFRLRSTLGAYIELDSLEPEATVTQRSI
jgi:hypothetical protein